MSTKSPEKPSDNLHEEEAVHARFPVNETPGGVYDERHHAPAGDPSDPRGEYDPQTTPLGDTSDPRGDDKKLSADELKDKESSGFLNPRDNTASKEASSLGGGLYSGEETAKSRFSRFRLSRRQGIGAAAAVTVVIGGASIFSVIQGPFQFIHISQFLQKSYLSKNERFGDSRNMKLTLYALAGATEKGRLGYVGNKYADRMEKQMIQRLGIKPIYNDNSTGRHAGYAIVDEERARASGVLVEIQNEVPGTSFKTVEDITGTKARFGGGKSIDPGTKVVHFPPGTKASYLRSVNRIVVKSLGKDRLSTAIASRVSVKRSGGKLSFLNGREEKRDKKADAATEKKNQEEFAKKVQEEREKVIKDGVKTGTPSGEAKELEEKIEAETEGKSGPEADAIRKSLIKAGGAAAALGLLCTADDIGNAAEDAKFTNNVLPLIRNFWYFVSVGDKAIAGDHISLDELSVLQKTLYDDQTQTHVLQAAPLQAEEGKEPSGPDVPIGARPTSLEHKPDAFKAVSAVLGYEVEVLGVGVSLGTGCAAFDKISSWPGISQLSDLSAGTINFILNRIGTSTEEIMLSVIQVINGDGVDISARGGVAGALLGMGGKLASIDQGISMGATSLTPAESAQLKQEQQIAERNDRKYESVARRYLDPSSTTSLLGSIQLSTPSIKDNAVAKIANPLSSAGSLFSNIIPLQSKASAAPGVYNYGLKDYGYSIADQDDGRFENPYDNAVIVEPKLDELNEKYSKCFGIKVTADDAGVHIKSSQVNILKLEKSDEFSDCRKFTNTARIHETNENKGLLAKINSFLNPSAYAQATTEPESEEAVMFKRYRFYIADSMTALSMACYEADDEDSCNEIYGSTASQGEAAVEPNSAAGKDPPNKIGDYTLTANEKKHLKYIASNVVSRLNGSPDKQAQTAAESAWWALRDSVLALSDPFGYSNCEVPVPGTGEENLRTSPGGRNNHIDETQLCPEGRLWQVGIGGVQVPNHSNNARVVSEARKYNSGKSTKEILAGVSILAGFNEGTPVYSQIVNSTGRLQTSLLLRDPATGIALVNGDVQPCLGGSPDTWCKAGKPELSKDPSTIRKAIEELKAYFISANDGGQEEGAGT